MKPERGTRGKIIAYDDSFEHYFFNNGTSDLIILAADIWHPVTHIFMSYEPLKKFKRHYLGVAHFSIVKEFFKDFKKTKVFPLVLPILTTL